MRLQLFKYFNVKIFTYFRRNGTTTKNFKGYPDYKKYALDHFNKNKSFSTGDKDIFEKLFTKRLIFKRYLLFSDLISIIKHIVRDSKIRSNHSIN